MLAKISHPSDDDVYDEKYINGCYHHHGFIVFLYSFGHPTSVGLGILTIAEDSEVLQNWRVVGQSAYYHLESCMNKKNYEKTKK